MGIDPLETTEELDAFAQEYGATWPVARDMTSITAEAGIRSRPGFVIIDDEGVMRYRHEGTAVDADALRDVIRRIDSR